MELLNMLRTRILAFAGTRLLVVFLVIMVLGAGAVFAANFLPTAAMVFLGSLGGFLWFLGLDAAWMGLVPPHVRSRLDLRGDRPLGQRRLISAGLVGAWFTLVIWIDRADVGGAGASSLESPLLGALTVVLALVAYRVGSASTIERLSEETAYEEWLSRQRKKEPKRGRRRLWSRSADNDSDA